MSVNRWEDAAFEMDHLLAHLDDYFGRLCDGYQSSAFGLDTETGSPHIVTSVHREMFQRADPIYVSADSMTLWEYARETFEPAPIQRIDLVVPCGFALLPWPTLINDVSDLRVAYRAVAWMPISQEHTYSWDDDVPGQGVWVSMFSHLEDADQVWDESRDEGDLRRHARKAGWRWSLLHSTPLIFGDRTWERFEPGPDRENSLLLFRQVTSLWRLMSQLVPVSTPLPRQARRQAARKARPTEVTVIHLRRARPGGPDHEHRNVEWDHRWLVRGHWRKQPYGPKDNPEYRQIWISPYVKGPEDKPIKPTKRAFVFDR
jgi:hypothetical protein